MGISASGICASRCEALWIWAVEITIVARSCAAGLKQSAPGRSSTMRTDQPSALPPSERSVPDEPELAELTWAGAPLSDA